MSRNFLLLAALVGINLLPTCIARAQAAEEDIVLFDEPINADAVLSAQGQRRKELLAAGEKAVAERTFHTLPSALQFSCAVMLDSHEDAWRRILIEGDGSERVIAARVLWRGRSRRYLPEVLAELDRAKGDAAAQLRRAINDEMSPSSIRDRLKHGDYTWAPWLAYVRPQKELVPALRDAWKASGTESKGILLALGRSRDRRALSPLLLTVASDDSVLVGYAARALGELGFAEAEPHLLKALLQDSPWVRANAASALGKVGTKASLPALKELSASKAYTGAIGVRRVAQDAVVAIEARENAEENQ